MMNFRKYTGILALTALVSFSSCSEWDGHFEKGVDGNVLSSLSLYEALCQDRETQDFAKLVAQAGYDKVLSESQTYTVFAPTNAALQNFDSSNKEELKRLVTNHIARFNNPSSTPAGQGIQMLNGKIYNFDDASSFNGCHLDKADERTKNGLIHLVAERIPYAYNIYEYIKANPNYSKLYDFIHQFDETKFDEDNSVEIDIDEQGRPVYDSVWVSYNKLLEHKTYGIGHIAKEDSIYTMLIPDNQAWDAAYARIHPYYKVYSTRQEEADSIQDIRTKLAIVSDLIYRGKHEHAATEDSLVSTNKSVIHQPATLFGNTTSQFASNGYIYPVSDLAYDNTETWNKKIAVEGEEQNGRSYNNTLTSVYTRTIKSESSVKAVSGDSYIEVLPISAATNPSVNFEIPNVLSGKYNIYAVFLPATMDGEEAELDSTKIQFTLSYQNTNGRNASKTNKSKDFLTSSKEMTKMLAFENFEFPVSDYTDNLWRSEDENKEEDLKVKTTLTIMTNVTAKEYSSGKYARSFRLDRIILEPIKN